MASAKRLTEIRWALLLIERKTMKTRREFIQAAPAVGAAFAVAGHVALGESPAIARESAPFKDHFHPKGKSPSQHTLDVLKKAKATLPFADTRDFAEKDKGSHRSDEGPEDHGRRRACRVGHGAI